MKKINILILFISGVLLIVSCLGEGGHVVEYGSQPGVVVLTDDQTYIQTVHNKLLQPSTSTSLNFGDGECVLIDYRVDRDDNKDSDNIWSVQFTTQPSAIKKWAVQSTLTDTSGLLSRNERIVNTFDRRHAAIRNQLFLYTTFHVVDSIPINNRYDLSYSSTQDAPLDTTVNAHVYELFLRVEDITENEAKTGDKSKLDINAFSISNFVNTFGPEERGKGHSEMYIKIKYARSFNSDSTSITWGESNIFSIPLE